MKFDRDIEKKVKQMRKSVNCYKVNPHVSTTQVQKRNTVSTIVLPTRHPKKITIILTYWYLPPSFCLQYHLSMLSIVNITVKLVISMLAVVNYAAVHIIVHFLVHLYLHFFCYVLKSRITGSTGIHNFNTLDDNAHYFSEQL